MSILPWTGALGGLVSMVLVYAATNYMHWSALLIAFIVVLWMAIFTGGLHLDGLIDTGDAFFSYRDTERRLEILSDSRVGAFGVMTFIFLLVGKLIVMQELLLEHSPPYWAFVFLPLLTRVGMGLFFMSTPSSKASGLGHFFKEKTNNKVLIMVSFLTLILAVLLIGFSVGVWGVSSLLVVALVSFVWLYRRWALKNFNGLSGDLLGAFIEGAEFGLWILLLLFIS